MCQSEQKREGLCLDPAAKLRPFIAPSRPPTRAETSVWLHPSNPIYCPLPPTFVVALPEPILILDRGRPRTLVGSEIVFDSSTSLVAPAALVSLE
jgi:hypothetical protein